LYARALAISIDNDLLIQSRPQLQGLAPISQEIVLHEFFYPFHARHRAAAKDKKARQP